MRFKLLQGKHESGHPMHRDKATGEIEREDTRKFYDARDPDKNIVDHSSDLVAMFGREKFERLPDEPKPKKKK